VSPIPCSSGTSLFRRNTDAPDRGSGQAERMILPIPVSEIERNTVRPSPDVETLCDA